MEYDNKRNSKFEKKKKIVIIGYYGYDNIGDESILECLIKRYNDKYDILVVSGNYKKTEEKYHVNAINKFDFIGIKNNIKSSEAVIFAGGNLFQDSTSSKSLYYYLLLLTFAKFHKKKIILLSQGIGEINKEINNKLLKRSLTNINQTMYLRDKKTIHYLNDIGITSTKFMPDISLAYEPTRTYGDQYIKARFNIDINKPTVIIGVRKWKEDTLDVMTELTERIIQDFSMQVVFVPFEFEQDLEFINKIIQNVDYKLRDSVLAINKEYILDELISIIRLSKIVIGIRLHASIFGIKEDIRTIPISYENKVDDVLDTLGIKTVCRYTEHMNVETILNEMARENNISYVKPIIEEYIKEIKKIFDEVEGVIG